MRGLVLGTAVVLALGWSRGVGATTVRGTLVTNFVSATFGSATGGSFAVSYAATASFYVEAPLLWFWKMADPWAQMPGGCVEFTLWVWNYSTVMTSYNITINDMLPGNMIYENPSFSSWNGGTAGTWYASYSANGVAYSGGEPNDGQGAPYYMKWVLTQLGVYQSAYVKFTACIL